MLRARRADRIGTHPICPGGLLGSAVPLPGCLQLQQGRHPGRRRGSRRALPPAMKRARPPAWPSSGTSSGESLAAPRGEPPVPKARLCSAQPQAGREAGERGARAAVPARPRTGTPSCLPATWRTAAAPLPSLCWAAPWWSGTTPPPAPGGPWRTAAPTAWRPSPARLACLLDLLVPCFGGGKMWQALPCSAAWPLLSWQGVPPCPAAGRAETTARALLAEGRVDPATGNLACSYHGWQFNERGRCTAIPQASAKTPLHHRTLC